MFKMNPPVPAPRSGDIKKPIPAPRKSKIVSTDDKTFTRNVRSKSITSKQIVDGIGELVQDKKKDMIEFTRQSVRKITKRFSSGSMENNADERTTSDNELDDSASDIFSSIRFVSPIESNADNIYTNMNNECRADDQIGLPPPSHPPPPLPDESVYDAPSSIISCGTSYSTKSSVSHTTNDSSSASISALSNLSNETDSSFKTSNSAYSNYLLPEASSSERNMNEILQPTTPKEDIYEQLFQAGSSTSVPVNNNVVRESVILQFDPLKNSSVRTSGDTNYYSILESNDLYGNVSYPNTIDSWSLSNDSDTNEDTSGALPPIPIRFDSLPEESVESKSEADTSSNISHSNWYLNDAAQTSNNSTESTSEPQKNKWLKKQFKTVIEKADSFRSRRSIVVKQKIQPKSVIQRKGMLYKVQRGPVEDLFGEYGGRWCVLENAQLSCYSDVNCNNLKERIPMQKILSVQIIHDVKYMYDSEYLNCFEINTTDRTRIGHIYGSKQKNERRKWMQCLADSLTNKFSTKQTSDYTRIGWSYLRKGISGKWEIAWIMLTQRKLFYSLEGESTNEIDLRKARCIILQTPQESDNTPQTKDKGPNMLIDCISTVLYFRMWTSRETKMWCYLVKQSAHDNGTSLEQQQLTKDDIPVIVEKCINFIYTYGSMSEGIYRRAGSGKMVNEILSKFNKDAFAVQLTTDTCTEFEVGTILKRFFRELSEPLFNNVPEQYFYDISQVQSVDDKVRMYMAALDHLPAVSYKTARKLIGHLHFISTQHTKNLMTTQNLAGIWGPTLMCQKDNGENPESYKKSTNVLIQIIELSPYIFPENSEVLEKEKVMLKVLERHLESNGAVKKNKAAGDFRIWVYLERKDGKSHNVAIGPNKTAYQLCLELSSSMKLPVDRLILEEVILNESLVRPIHHNEKLLDVILRWGYWDEPDRKDNHLIISPLSKYSEIIAEKYEPSQCEEMRFADSKTKILKNYLFKFKQARLDCLREDNSVLHSWNIEDIIWYVGQDPKRNLPSQASITFIELKGHPNRSKTSPFFGNIVVWKDKKSRTAWLSTMINSRYIDGITPPAQIINLE